MDYCLERAFLEITCEQMGTSRDELKKQRHAACGSAKMIGDAMKLRTSISALAVKLGMSRQNFYRGRRARREAETDIVLKGFWYRHCRKAP
jgi:hypothetical protein